MSNPPPPPFQVPDDNDPANDQQQWQPPQQDQQNWQQQVQPPGQPPQYGPPQGDPQAFTPPYGQPTPYSPQQPQAPQQQTPQWQPPQPDQQQWQPPQQGQQYAPPQQGQQWQPPQQGQQFAPPPPAQQQYAPPPPPQAQSQPPPYVPPQQGQPQWSGGGGFVDTPAAAGPAGMAGAGGAAFAPGAMPPPMAPPTSFDSGPGSSMPPPMGPPTSYDSGPGSSMPPPNYDSRPGSGSGFPPPAAQSAASYGPPSHPQDLQLGPPRAPRPAKYKRSFLLPTAVATLLVAAVAIPGAIKQAERDPAASSAGKPLATAEVLWSIREGRDGPPTPQPPKQSQPILDRPGAWYTDQNVVIAEAKRLAAYNLDTGALAWEYSSDDKFLCDVDLQGDSKQAFVAFGDEKDCTTLEAIDVVAGKKIWSASTMGSADSDVPDFGGYSFSTGIAVSGGVAVFDGQAFQTSDGKKLWSADTALGEDCSTSTSGFAGGARLVVVASCGGLGSGGSTAMELDPRTGRPKWQFDVAGGGIGETVEVVSTDPVMLMKAPSLISGAPPEITVLNDQGREAFKITEGHPVAAPRGSINALSGAIPILSTDKVIYVPGSDMSGSLSKLSVTDGANQLTAYDRATGQKLWTQSVASGSSIFKMKSQGQIFPIRIEESGDLLLLVQDGGATNGRPMNLIRVSAKDGSMTNLKELPNRVTPAKGLMQGVLVHEKDGRVYLTGSPLALDPLYEDMPIKNALGQAVHYNMSSYRVIAMQ